MDQELAKKRQIDATLGAILQEKRHHLRECQAECGQLSNLRQTIQEELAATAAAHTSIGTAEEAAQTTLAAFSDHDLRAAMRNSFQEFSVTQQFGRQYAESLVRLAETVPGETEVSKKQKQTLNVPASLMGPLQRSALPSTSPQGSDKHQEAIGSSRENETAALSKQPGNKLQSPGAAAASGSSLGAMLTIDKSGSFLRKTSWGSQAATKQKLIESAPRLLEVMQQGASGQAEHVRSTLSLYGVQAEEAARRRAECMERRQARLQERLQRVSMITKVGDCCQLMGEKVLAHFCVMLQQTSMKHSTISAQPDASNKWTRSKMRYQHW